MHAANTVKVKIIEETWEKDPSQPSDDIDSTLTERGHEYGTFNNGAKIMQVMKEILRCGTSWENMTASQAEALDMIAHKMGRIVNGNPDNRDSWFDIAGYATLIVKQLDGENP